MATEKTYSVSWEINAIAGMTPLQAALECQSYLKSLDDGGQQLYVQDEDTKELFSVDLSEYDENLDEDVTGEPVVQINPNEYRPTIEIPKKKTIYLFGDEAVKTLEDEGEKMLLDELENFGLSYTLFTFIEGETSSAELLSAFVGNNNYSIITEELYNQIQEI